jgi:two-component system NarL family sensor kinase
VKVFQDKNNLTVEVRDQGKGISEEKRLRLTSSGGGVGLRGMKERIHQLGGTLVITSSDDGTRVVVTLPVPKVVVPNCEGAA